MNPEIIGYLAATLTTAAYVPQLAKVLKERNTQSISLVMYIILTIGIGCWFGYGCLLGSVPMMLANGISFLITAGILAAKLRLG